MCIRDRNIVLVQPGDDDIQIEPQHDRFDDVRMEYAQMLKQQLAKGNNGLVRTK